MSEVASEHQLAKCSICNCANYIIGIAPGSDCAACNHPKSAHHGHGHHHHGHDDHGHGSPLRTSVLKPVSVKNTGNKVLVFVGDEPRDNFKLAPGETRILLPGNYRVQVDFTKPPIVIVIAKIVYDRKLKKFDIQAEDGLEGARFVTSVDLEAVGPRPTGAEEV